jgi:5-methylthioadenosine/S-adenosylhomocysteine deaminase
MSPSAPSTFADLLIKGGVVVTMDTAGTLFEEGYVLVRNDRIVAVGEMRMAPPDAAALTVINAQGKLVMPGLINTHTHAAMTCLRGLADDLPLKTWWEEYIFPVESRQVDPKFVYHGTMLAGIEMIKSGTTCFCDGYFFEAEAARAVTELGLRAMLAEGIVDFPTPDVPDPAQNLKNASRYLEEVPAHSRITSTLFCHSAYTCTPRTLQAVSTLCRHHQVPFLLHLAETEAETEDIKRVYGTTPAQHLYDLGAFDHETIAAHCVWVSPEEQRLLKEKRVRVAHCPESNMKLASGVAPVPDLLACGIPVGLGTDGCASNNNLDMFSEMDAAAKVHKLVRKDPSVMDAHTVVRMATIGAAEVLGMQDTIGSLEPGKQADIIILDWRRPHLTPVYNYYSHLVYTASGHDVCSVLVDGKLLMHDRKVLTVDEGEVMAEVNRIGERIKKGLRRR